ncbi:hypothetical protein VNI00_000886 [Paramarasmius palmivorus]|uniref:F-box domain-containing protein n=1 Tax=Paramarasmius palmivorus TaxID=297713 RepID=A0AAW0E8A0_9AGAR
MSCTAVVTSPLQIPAIASNIVRLYQTNECPPIFGTPLCDLQHALALDEQETRMYRRVLHPIRRLPDLVLVEIFKHHMGTIDHRPPWTLSQVCYKWRQVSLSRSSFWSNINLSMTYVIRETRRPHLLLDRLRDQLQKSKNHALSVSLSLQTSIPTQQEWSPVLKTICAASGRWETLKLAADVENLRFLHSTMNGTPNFPSLRSLNLMLLGHSHPVAANSDLSLFENAPRLHDLTVMVDIYGDASSLGIPFTQITRARVYHVSKGTLSLLKSMSNLEILHVDRVSLRNTSDIDLISLPSLHTLSITSGTESSLAAFLDYLQVPNLHSLKVGVGAESIMGAFLTRCRKLRSLALKANETDDFEWLLESLPKEINSLSLFSATGRAVCALSRRQGKLAELRLFSRRIEDSTLIEAVESLGLRQLWLHDSSADQAANRIREMDVEVHQRESWWSDFLSTHTPT